ncbi:hypothetical protein [Clavibacter michiganensis]|uniref:Uncharacterized protein n=1 Tax=Clavibacter michiganensis subsp. insidiosus TaxID=33014 RepID=A0A0D5CLD4_9MICO|nr:hypothetical protein [Clavibacter michiganensis]AJW80077.1 hypothetical protein VO01_13945 [Clavibacter michiganensis subsp. insidiosus]AWF97272.1 hypothetical protein BEH61_02005 [Clavibacter michiganensis subsp. insidiosus]AWG02640.1 hypothetical protein BEH62_13655 [Clavibacter michiganensis subsp. insidiosus]OQJ61218.1 hypothetical protein B5P21_02725 [Clavibacter michiganensis subsp. insidiosus]RII85556.1 hypothetical protein DZF92_13770 [Clavibacter michiganensis subsp. insidiosus]
MGLFDAPVEVRPAERALRVLRLVELDYLREVRRLLDSGYDAAKLVQDLAVFQPVDLDRIAAAREVPVLVEGFSGATPYEICERYSVGMLDRERLVDELVRFPYVPRDQVDGYDDLVVNPPGTFMDVSRATTNDLIDIETYGQVVERLHVSGD